MEQNIQPRTATYSRVFISNGVRRQLVPSFDEPDNFQTLNVVLLPNYSDTYRIDEVREQVDDVRGQMSRNIDHVIENQDRIDRLQDKSEDMKQSAGMFKKGSNELKSAMYWRNAKLMMAIILIVLVCLTVVFIIIVLFFMILMSYLNSILGNDN